MILPIFKETCHMAINPTPSRKDGLILFFIFTYAITWGIGAFAIFLPAQFQAVFGDLTGYNPVAFVAVAAPTISATILALAQEGRSGLGTLYAHLFHWRVGIQWYGLILAGIPLAGWLTTLVIKPEPKVDLSTPALIISALIYLLIFGPLIEEPGWRGYALPRLLKRFSPFVSGLVLGAIWGVWHLPSFFISTLVQSGLSLPIFLVMGLCTSILMTWIFQHTGGSILIAILFHYAINFALSFIGAPLPVFGGVILVAAVLVVVLDKGMGWFRKAQGAKS
jgi:hypothetical protein